MKFTSSLVLMMTISVAVQAAGRRPAALPSPTKSGAMSSMSQKLLDPSVWSLACSVGAVVVSGVAWWRACRPVRTARGDAYVSETTTTRELERRVQTAEGNLTLLTNIIHGTRDMPGIDSRLVEMADLLQQLQTALDQKISAAEFHAGLEEKAFEGDLKAAQEVIQSLQISLTDMQEAIAQKAPTAAVEAALANMLPKAAVNKQFADRDQLIRLLFEMIEDRPEISEGKRTEAHALMAFLLPSDEGAAAGAGDVSGRSRANSGTAASDMTGSSYFELPDAPNLRSTGGSDATAPGEQE